MKLNAIDKYKELNEWLLNELSSKGWDVDRWGHAKFDRQDGKKVRWKFGRTSVRKEVQLKFSNGNEWVRVKTIFYKDIKRNGG
jgi:hypothetical protein